MTHIVRICCVLLITFCVISVCFANEEDDNSHERESRGLHSHHLSSLHLSHLGHHGPHGHLGHISHHGHSLHHKLGHLKQKLGFHGLHLLHRRSAPQDDDEILLHDDVDDDSHIRQRREASHLSDEDEIHPKSGPFIDVWSKKQKSNVYHSNPTGEHFHHEGHIVSHHSQDQHEDNPCPHAAPPVSHHGSSFHHSQSHSHETEINHPTHHSHHQSESHEHGAHHGVLGIRPLSGILGIRPLSLGHRGHGLLIKKELSINKFRSADGEDEEDNIEDDSHAFDHVDENGVFGGKP